MITSFIQRFIYLILLFCFHQLQAQIIISGHVSTPDKKPLALVSVTLLRENHFMGGDVSDSAGNFTIKASYEINTVYTLQLSLVGYRSLNKNFIYPDTGFITHLELTERSPVLSGVTVVARKPLITRKADRYVVNVENSYLADGRSGLEVLQQSPGLWVDGNGSIRIKGSQAVTVMINDVIQRLSESELADYLRTLKSEDISKIEIISNPPGEYEASATGGMVHIILKKSRRDGITGAVYAQYRQQGNRPYTSAGTSLDFKNGKLYLFGNFSLTNDKSFYTGYNSVMYPDQSTLSSSGDRNNNNSRQQYRLGMTYDFSATHSLNVQTTSTTSALVQFFSSNIIYRELARVTTGYAQTDWIRHPRLSSTTLNYAWKTDTLGSSLKLMADFTSSSKAEYNTLKSFYDDSVKNAYSRSQTPSATDIFSLQADYTMALNQKTAWKAGAKYVVTERHNTIISDKYVGSNWIANQGASSDFIYNEKLLMGYLSFEKTIGSTSLKGGIRGEQTYSQGRSLTTNEQINKKYFGLFPSLFISHILNEKKGNLVQLNYSRRVKRPGYNDLNPYRLQLSDYSILTGNPNLLPQFAHNIEGGYTLLHNYTAGIYLLATQQYIAQTATTIDSNVIKYQSKNFRGSTEYGITLNASNTIAKVWNTNINFILYHVAAALKPTLTQISYSIKSIHTISLKKIVDISIYAEYNAPYLSANARQAAIFNMEMGVAKKIGNTRLRLYLSDVFNTVREKDVTEYSHTRIDFYQKRPTRTISISLTYNFKAGKTFTHKKLEQSNSEEKNRL